MTARKGDKAPPFVLPHKPGETEDVGAIFGREPVILLFFPLAFSSVCTDEMCQVPPCRGDASNEEEVEPRDPG